MATTSGPLRCHFYVFDSVRHTDPTYLGPFGTNRVDLHFGATNVGVFLWIDFYTRTGLKRFKIFGSNIHDAVLFARKADEESIWVLDRGGIREERTRNNLSDALRVREPVARTRLLRFPS